MTPSPIHIDGSQGEGGGQILRSSLALSMALRVPVRISNIRANRPKPGLMRQHLTAVEAAVAICGGAQHAHVLGATPGSRELTFTPAPIRGGSYSFSIGTAGSTTLVLQAILPALLIAHAPSEIYLEGGTHARWAPPFDFFARALVPLLQRLGPTIDASIGRHGFYPAGGGRLRIRVTPNAASSLSALSLMERGEILHRRCRVLLAKLPYPIAGRELEQVERRLNWPIATDCVHQITDTISPGNAITLEVESEHVREVFCALGEHGKPAPTVADEAIDGVREYLAAGVPVGPYLADQLMVPLAIAAARGAGRSEFLTTPLTRHAQTNSDVIAAFGLTPTIERDGDRVRWSIG